MHRTHQSLIEAKGQFALAGLGADNGHFRPYDRFRKSGRCCGERPNRGEQEFTQIETPSGQTLAMPGASHRTAI